MIKLNFRALLWPAVACVVLLALASCARQENLASGLSYRLQPEPDQRYPDAGAGMLTDGLYAPPEDLHHGWVGFNEDEPTITLDLHTVCKVERVEASFLEHAEFGVELPESVELLVSQDGDRWISMGLLTGTEDADGSVFSLDTPGLRVRYVRLTIERNNWTLIDEVRILGSPSRSLPVPVLTGNLALGLAYELNPQPNSKYADVDGGTLTDSKHASAEDLQHGWVGFDDGQPTITLDLGTVCKIDRIEASFLSYPAYGIALPASAELLVSQDGRRWIAYGMLSPTETDAEVFELDTPQLRVRYVRLGIARDGESWTFIDEIKVFGSIAPALHPVVPIISGNLATGIAYMIEPAPSQEYPDANGTMLTDGEHASPDDLQRGWVGFDTGEPTVTMDLESVCRISSVEATFLWDDESGVELPRSVKLLFSLDGERWFLGGSLSAPKIDTAPFRLEMASLRARFLRVVIEREHWTLLDEINVFGSMTPTFFSYLSIERWDVWAGLPDPPGLLTGPPYRSRNY